MAVCGPALLAVAVAALAGCAARDAGGPQQPVVSAAPTTLATTTTAPETATTAAKAPQEATTTAPTEPQEAAATASPETTTTTTTTTAPQTTTTTTTTTEPPATTTTTTTTTTTPPETTTTTLTPYQRDLAAANRLAPHFVMPNDCRPPPLNSPYSMPNAPRAYRSGVHAGVDFLCSTAGHPVVSVLGGQVVVAAGGYVDPTFDEWNELLAVAIALGDTPAYTNAMLSGAYVVVDHGIIPEVGHVVSLYAHLDGVDPGIRVGKRVEAGQRLGGIGNTGTRAGASGNRYGQLHLHWNFYVDDRYLGAGLSTAETRAVYTELFRHATGAGTEAESPGIAAGGTPQPSTGAPAPGSGPAEPATITPNGRRPLGDPIPLEAARAAAERLAANIVVPSDCEPVPLDRASALPNAPRPYRSGTHQGIDFGCPARGHPAVAALAGRVVVAVGDFEDPTPLEWNQLLDTASAIGATPPYTLVMLYGNHMAVDHGIIDGVGHVVSLYAHLDGLEPGIRPGLSVEAGQRLGTIGNSGTRAGAAGAVHDQLHLHWELHIDGQYLGIGLSHDDTRAVYATLFGNVNG